MKYISKGAIMRECTEEILYVSRCGKEYALSKPSSILWLEGRFRVHETRSELEDAKLAHLIHIGLVEVAEDDSRLAQYRMLSQCVILPATLKKLRRPLNAAEKNLWTWISEAGLCLTMAELVFLVTNEIKPTADLLGMENLQALTERIYTVDNIRERVLDIQMETAAGRDAAIDAVLGLLHKKHLVLV